MDMPSSYSGSAIFDIWSFDKVTTSSGLSSFDGQGTDTLEQLLNQPSDFHGIGDWVDDGLSNSVFPARRFRDCSASTNKGFIDVEEIDLWGYGYTYP